MIRLPAPLTNDNSEYLIVCLEEQCKDRPCIQMYNNCYQNARLYWFTASEELHTWMTDNNIKYDLYSEPVTDIYYMSMLDYWFIVFENDNDALLYKLTWL
jgi:hypothetical protein